MHATALSAIRTLMVALGLALAFGLAIGGASAPAAAQDPSTDPRPAPQRTEGEGPFDRLTIRNTTLIDGTGAPPRGPVDIVIERNRIVSITTVGATLGDKIGRAHV